MDFMKIFRRQKSVGKQEKAEETVSYTVPSTDSPEISNGQSTCDVNSNAKLKNEENHVQKEPKGWRRSFRRLRKKKESVTSNSCDDILGQHGRTSLTFESENNSESMLSKQQNRWSYSPYSKNHPVPFFEPDGLKNEISTNYEIPLEHTRNEYLQTFSNSRNTFGAYVTNCKPSTLPAQDHEYEDIETKNIEIQIAQPRSLRESQAAKAQSTGNIARDSGFSSSSSHISFSYSHSTTTIPNTDQSYSPQNEEPGSEDFEIVNDDYKKFAEPIDLPSDYCLYPRKHVKDFQPHSTLYEREAETVLDSLNKVEAVSEGNRPVDEDTEEKYDDVDFDTREEVSGDNLSWASNEFDSDSNESGQYENDVDDQKARDKNEEKDNFVVRTHREFAKNVRKFKFLERRNASQKKHSREEEMSSFVDFHISPEKHPGPHLQPPTSILQPHELCRRKIVETIIRSESSYIDSLERLEICYKKVLLESKAPLISAENVERIFYKISDILQCHQLFQIALASTVNNWDEHQTIGDTFVASFSKSMVLECYSSYINNFTNAMELVRKTCIRKPQFLIFLRERQNESENRLNLYGLMLKPVQRFPQFILLVQDLLKNTPTEHADRLPLQLALTELETLAENLNQRRAENEEISDMVHLLDSSNIKLLSNLTKDGRTRRLLKQGVIRECTFTEEGTIEKDRECLLVLTNDMLLSCSGANRRQQQRTSVSTFRDLYKLKWRAPLDIVKITDSTSISVQEYSMIKEDRQTLHNIRKLMDDLHYPYEGFQSQQIDSDITSLDARIEKAEKVTSLTSDSFNVTFPQKSGDFKRTLVMPDTSQYNDWMDAIINAKLANEPKNLHSWYSADGSDSEFLWKPPLFLESFECLANNHNSLQIQCAYAFMPVSHITLLWLACSASTVIAVVNVYQIIDNKVEKVHVMQVESSVQCMEHWNPGKNRPSLWLGMECGSLIEFSADTTYNKICEVTMPTMSTVMIMKGYERNLYVGLLDGSLLMYSRPEGMSGLVHIQSITVGNGPLNCLSPLDGKLWGSSGNDIVTLNLEDFKIESLRTIHTDNPLTVSHVVQVGGGLWVAFCDNCNLHLYHLDTLKLLQDLNLSRPVRDFFQSLGCQSRVNELFHVTSLCSSYWQLVVGTSNGLILAMPLPKLPDSVPKITGPCRICYHMLNGPVTFLCAPSMPVTSKIPNCEPQKDASTPDRSSPVPLSESPPEIPVRSPIKRSSNGSSDNHFKMHKRTSSEGVINISASSSVSTVSSKRFSTVESYISSPIILNEQEMNKPLIPPALPPKPNTPRANEVSCAELLEDDSVYHNREVEKLQTPTKMSIVQWKESRGRNFPVLLACGDSPKTSTNTSGSSQRATTLLCWKIMT